MPATQKTTVTVTETPFVTILAASAHTAYRVNILGLRNANINRRAGKDMTAQQADNFRVHTWFAHGVSLLVRKCMSLLLV